MITKTTVTAIVAALALWFPITASARPLTLDARQAASAAADPPEGFQPRLSAATGVLCVKQCPNDDLPCDPPSYKIADGRCTTQWH